MKRVVFLCIAALFAVVTSYSNLPTCLDIYDISPNPPSVMQRVDWNVNKFGLQIVFSEPVREGAMIPSYLSPVIPPSKELPFLHISTTILRPFHTYYNWLGSERAVFLVFNNITSSWSHRKWYLIMRNEKFTANVGVYQFDESQTTSSHPIQRNPYCYTPKRRPFHFPLMRFIWLDYDSSQNTIGNLIRMNISANDFISTIGDLPTGYGQSNTTKLYVPVVLKHQQEPKPLPRTLKVRTNIDNLNATVQLPDLDFPRTINSFKLKIPVKVTKLYSYRETVTEVDNHLQQPLYSFGCPEGSRRNPSYLSGHLTHNVTRSEDGYLIVADNPKLWLYEDESSSISTMQNTMQSLQDRGATDGNLVKVLRSIPWFVLDILTQYKCILPIEVLNEANEAPRFAMGSCKMVSHNWMPKTLQNEKISCEKYFGDELSDTNQRTITSFSNAFNIAFQHLSSLFNLRDFNFEQENENRRSARIVNLLDGVYRDYQENFYTKATISNEKEFNGLTKTEYITYKDYLDSLNVFVEVVNEFIILKPSLFNFRRTMNTCDKILSFVPPKSIDGNMQLIVKVYNYGSVSYSDISHPNIIQNMYCWGEVNQETLLVVFRRKVDDVGGGDITFEVELPHSLQLRSIPKMTTTWIEPSTTLSVRFSVYTQYGNHARKLEELIGVLHISVKGYESEEYQDCPIKITLYSGFFVDPCKFRDKLPPVILNYYSIPSKYSKNTESHFGHKSVKFIKSIMLETLLEPRHKQEWVLSSFNVNLTCSSNVVGIVDGNLLQYFENKVIQDNTYFTNHLHYPSLPLTKLIVFYSKRGLDESKPSQCNLMLIRKESNGYCTDKEVVVQQQSLAIIKADIYANKRYPVISFLGINIHFLYFIYGDHGKLNFGIIVATLIMSILLINCTLLFGLLKYFYTTKRKLPSYYFLNKFTQERFAAMEEDDNYWSLPRVFLEREVDDAKNKPYFTLHNFSCIDEVTLDISKLRLSGSLKYKNKELVIVITSIENMFVPKALESEHMWLQTASGVYLLKYGNCNQAFQQQMKDILEKKELG